MDLSDINMTSSVNEKGDPFVTVVATSSKGDMMIGQLSPDEVRQHGLAYLEVAEAAQQDAAVLRVIRKLGLPDDVAGPIIIELRNMRAEG